MCHLSLCHLTLCLPLPAPKLNTPINPPVNPCINPPINPLINTLSCRLLVFARLVKLRNEEDLESMQLKSTACALTKFLVSVCKNNFVNQMLLFCHKDLLSALFSASLGVVDAYTEMIRNNKQLIQEISAEDVQDIFDNLRQQQVHDHCGGRFVMLLSMLCQCNGVPVPANQNLVLNCFLLGHPELLLHTKVYPHDYDPVSFSLPSSPASLPLCLLTATP